MCAEGGDEHIVQKIGLYVDYWWGNERSKGRNKFNSKKKNVNKEDEITENIFAFYVCICVRARVCVCKRRRIKHFF